MAGYFSEGEELTVKVFANSTQILSVIDSITSAQENSGTINNSYNCQGAFGTATTHQIRTEVHLDDDRWLGVAENIDVTVTSEGVDEDDAENNNTLSDATPLTTNGVDYITRDPDYFEINISKSVHST